jgi:hypothetical protein
MTLFGLFIAFGHLSGFLPFCFALDPSMYVDVDNALIKREITNIRMVYVEFVMSDCQAIINFG